MDIDQIKTIMKGLAEPQLRETHISWVLLSGDKAYKIKKPVKFSFLDFSTLEKRKAACEDEVRLNRRLAPDVYLGVVAITREGKDGALRIGGDGSRPGFGGSGETVDFAVEMVRLDENRMMGRLLGRNEVTRGNVEELARIIADFHSRIERMKAKDGYNSPEMVREHIADLGAHRAAIDKAAGMGKIVDLVLERSEKFIKKNEGVLLRRLADGYVRECHGDLHSGNIFIEDGGRIHVIDCIEFSKDFRRVDVISEIAFMAMDLDAHDREDLAKAFIDAYQSKAKDPELGILLPFYKCYRANVRAKIAAIEFAGSGSGEAAGRIKRYMLLAERYAKML